MDVAAIGQVLNLGLSGVLLVAVWKLWERLNYITDLFLEDRARAKAERAAIGQAVDANMPPSNHNLPVQGR